MTWKMHLIICVTKVYPSAMVIDHQQIKSAHETSARVSWAYSLFFIKSVVVQLFEVEELSEGHIKS